MRGGRGGGGGGRGGRGDASRPSRRDHLRKVCSAIRSSQWDDVCSAIDTDVCSDTVEGLLDASPTGWGVGEYRAMAQAASQVTDWEGALKVLRRMADEGKPVDAAAYGHCVAACAKANKPVEGQRLLEQLSAAGVAAEARPYNQVMSAYARQRKWSEAIALLRDMRGAGAPPTVISYNAALSACANAGRWTEATELLEAMEGGDGVGTPRPDVISYSTVVSACQKAASGTNGAAASQALDILRRMQAQSAAAAADGAGAEAAAGGASGGASASSSSAAEGKAGGGGGGGGAPSANVFTYTSAISALADAGEWQQALETYRTIPESIELNEAIVHARAAAPDFARPRAGAARGACTTRATASRARVRGRGRCRCTRPCARPTSARSG